MEQFETNSVFETEDKYKFLKSWGVVFGALAVTLFILGVNPIVSLFILIAIASMYPMRFVEWLGIELCMFFTVLTSMVYGPVLGVLVGKISNTVGVTLAGQLDQNIIYDFGAFVVVALVASMFPVQYITIVGIALLLLYHAGYMIFNKALDTYDTNNILFSATNLLFNVIIFWRFAPIVAGLLV